MSRPRTILVTGSSGLIGSEVARYFSGRGWRVRGLDNNQRAVFFGEQGDTRWNLESLRRDLPGFEHSELDVRDRAGILALVEELRPDLIVHAAAQPSHDRAARIPFDDFDTNAGGTLNLLEAARRSTPEAPFVFLSTNKVYGDGPNRVALRETETRWDYEDPAFANGIPETFPIDQCTHSLFGVSKTAADLAVQEYGRYFGMPTCCVRGGCLTGPRHSGVELHGFLSYLVKSHIERVRYRIFGYKGKQVRDNLHSLDVARFVEAFAENPRSGVVYNLGGGKGNACSVLEAFARVAEITGLEANYEYVPEERIGDHICYYSDLTKIRTDYPGWDVSISLDQIFQELTDAWRQPR